MELASCETISPDFYCCIYFHEMCLPVQNPIIVIGIISFYSVLALSCLINPCLRLGAELAGSRRAGARRLAEDLQDLVYKSCDKVLDDFGERIDSAVSKQGVAIIVQVVSQWVENPYRPRNMTKLLREIERDNGRRGIRVMYKNIDGVRSRVEERDLSAMGDPHFVPEEVIAKSDVNG